MPSVPLLIFLLSLLTFLQAGPSLAGNEDLFDPALIERGVPQSAPLQALHGHWRGDGLEFFIDTSRMQGNTDSTRPFARESLVIRNVTPPWIVFAIGPSAFVAQVEGETMVLTQAGWPSPRTVVRLPAAGLARP